MAGRRSVARAGRLIRRRVAGEREPLEPRRHLPRGRRCEPVSLRVQLIASQQFSSGIQMLSQDIHFSVINWTDDCFLSRIATASIDLAGKSFRSSRSAEWVDAMIGTVKLASIRASSRTPAAAGWRLASGSSNPTRVTGWGLAAALKIARRIPIARRVPSDTSELRSFQPLGLDAGVKANQR